MSGLRRRERKSIPGIVEERIDRIEELVMAITVTVRYCQEILDKAGLPKRDMRLRISQLVHQRDALLSALKKAVSDYGKPGGPWNVPGEAGTWISMAKDAIEKCEQAKASSPSEKMV